MGAPPLPTFTLLLLANRLAKAWLDIPSVTHILTVTVPSGGGVSARQRKKEREREREREKQIKLIAI